MRGIGSNYTMQLYQTEAIIMQACSLKLDYKNSREAEHER